MNELMAGEDLSELKRSLRKMLYTARGCDKSLMWHPHGSDNTILAASKDICEALAQAIGMDDVLKWTTGSGDTARMASRSRRAIPQELVVSSSSHPTLGVSHLLTLWRSSSSSSAVSRKDDPDKYCAFLAYSGGMASHARRMQQSLVDELAQPILLGGPGRTSVEKTLQGHAAQKWHWKLALHTEWLGWAARERAADLVLTAEPSRRIQQENEWVWRVALDATKLHRAAKKHAARGTQHVDEARSTRPEDSARPEGSARAKMKWENSAYRAVQATQTSQRAVQATQTSLAPKLETTQALLTSSADASKLNLHQLDLLKGVKESAIFILMLSKDVFTDAMPMLQLWTALNHNKPVVLVNVEGAGYDFAANKILLSNLHTKLPQLAPGAASVLAAVLAPKTLQDLGAALANVVPNLIARTWHPDASANAMEAEVLDIIDAMLQAVQYKEHKQQHSGSGKMRVTSV